MCTGLAAGSTALHNCENYGNTTANYMTGETKVARAIAKIIAKARAKAKANAGMGPGGGRCTNWECMQDNLVAQGMGAPGQAPNFQYVTNDGNMDYIDIANSPPVTWQEHANALIATGILLLLGCTVFKPVCAPGAASVYAGAEATEGVGAGVTAAVTARGGVGRVFSSADPYVADAANAIEVAMPGRVLAVNTQVRMISGLTREVDVNLGNVLVQVKGGNARGLAGQIARTQVTTDRIVIGYAPDMPAAAWEDAARNGVAIARTPSELIAILGEVG